MTGAPGLDDWFPLDDQEHRAQVAGLLRLLGDAPARVLDLGCGDGRVLAPLAQAGHVCMGIDSDQRAIDACMAQHLRARRGDLLDPACDLWIDAHRPDAIVCLGHTFMLVVDPIAALDLLRRAHGALVERGGFFAIDAFPVPLWREVSEGYWQSGVAEDGSSQLVWAPGDNVLAFRSEGDIDERSWEPGPGDRPVRLWSMGELRLLAHVAGFADPEVLVTDHLIVMRAVR